MCINSQFRGLDTNGLVEGAIGINADSKQPVVPLGSRTENAIGLWEYEIKSGITRTSEWRKYDGMRFRISFRQLNAINPIATEVQFIGHGNLQNHACNVGMTLQVNNSIIGYPQFRNLRRIDCQRGFRLFRIRIIAFPCQEVYQNHVVAKIYLTIGIQVGSQIPEFRQCIPLQIISQILFISREK